MPPPNRLIYGVVRIVPHGMFRPTGNTMNLTINNVGTFIPRTKIR